MRPWYVLFMCSWWVLVRGYQTCAERDMKWERRRHQRRYLINWQYFHCKSFYMNLILVLQYVGCCRNPEDWKLWEAWILIRNDGLLMKLFWCFFLLMVALPKFSVVVSHGDTMCWSSLKCVFSANVYVDDFISCF